MLLAVGIDTVLLQLTEVVGVAVPDLVNVVTVTFAGTFAEIEGREVGVAVAEQRVTHQEVLIELGVASCDEVGLPGLLAFKLRQLRIHLSRSHLQPDELPVEVEVVSQFLATLEGCILDAALRLCSQGKATHEANRQDDLLHILFISLNLHLGSSYTQYPARGHAADCGSSAF